MTPARLAAFEARTVSGVYAFERKAPAELEPSQLKAFKANAAAWEFFDRQAPSYRSIALHWVVSAKQEQTRARRNAELVSDSASGLRIKSQRRR